MPLFPEFLFLSAKNKKNRETQLIFEGYYKKMYNEYTFVPASFVKKHWVYSLKRISLFLSQSVGLITTGSTIKVALMIRIHSKIM